jgi:hypothetical protein
MYNDHLKVGINGLLIKQISRWPLSIVCDMFKICQKLVYFPAPSNGLNQAGSSSRHVMVEMGQIFETLGILNIPRNKQCLHYYLYSLIYVWLESWIWGSWGGEYMQHNVLWYKSNNIPEKFTSRWGKEVHLNIVINLPECMVSHPSWQ